MLLIGVSGHELSARERDWLQHDACAGVVLFTRNFASRAQVIELTLAIRDCAPRPVLVCVDQEGGRVQRFRDGYAPLPALRGFEDLYRREPEAALALAHEHAWLMASEIRATGLDLSFAPVVDLAHGNRAIGNRAFACYISSLFALLQLNRGVGWKLHRSAVRLRTQTRNHCFQIYYFGFAFTPNSRAAGIIQPQ